MALADALKAETKTHNGPSCSLCALIPTMPKDDAASLAAALSDFGVHGTQIARALQHEGYDIRAHVVTRHRRGDCLPR
jgi:hypothetical protein